MDFKLVDSGWDKVFADVARTGHNELRIVCPFIKQRVIERLVKACKPNTLQVITRFSLMDFFNGVSDIAALRFLVESGAQVRGIRNLHAKLYLFGDKCSIVTSANLTDAAMTRNHEFGGVAEDPAVVGPCRSYFDNLWQRSGKNLTLAKIAGWTATVDKRLAVGGPNPNSVELPDEGVEAGFSPVPVEAPTWTGEATDGFVKFFGLSKYREAYNTSVLQAVKGSGCHWACTYPKGRHPRQQKDGAVMFMGQMMRDPNDIMIFGRAIAMEHKPGRDEATAYDMTVRTWKKDWPFYVRVHHGEFLDGTLADGVSLNKLMVQLGSDSFASTQRAAKTGRGSTNPRRAYGQRADIKLSNQALAWLTVKLEEAFVKHGKIQQAELAKLDWPETSKN